MLDQLLKKLIIAEARQQAMTRPEPERTSILATLARLEEES